MATSAGEVEVKLTLNADDFKRIMGESKDTLTSSESAMMASVRNFATEAGAAIIGWATISLKAYADNQLSVTRLIAALGSHGIASEELATHLQNQARSLEALSGIQEKNITNAQAMFVTYGMQGDVLDKATQAAVDFTARTGNLETSTNLLAKAFEGNTTMLKRYGITVDASLPQSQQFSALLDKIIKQFGPISSAQVGTFSGQITALTNAFTHLEEETGKIIAAGGDGILGWLTTLTNNIKNALVVIEDATDAVGNFRGVLAGVVLEILRSVSQTIVEIASHLTGLLALIPGIGPLLSLIKINVDGVNKSIDTQINQWQQLVFAENKALSQTLAGEATKVDAFKNTAQVHMNVHDAMTAWIINNQVKSKDAFLADLKEQDMGYSAFYDSFQTTTADLWGFATSMSNTFFQGFGDGFAKMVVEGKNFSESMKSLFRDMAEQMISYVIQIIAKMLVLFALEQATGLGPGISSGVSAFSGAFADGGVINEPSIITGLRSGRKILAGEAGPEMVTPMGGGNMTAGEMGGLPGGGGSGGGSITINISGQFIEGDSNSWNRLVREQIIPQIRRFTMSNPTGPFNRSRGVS